MAGELGFDTGPYVNVAAFCERVLDEKDGVLSAIRIVDTTNIQAQGPAAPDEIPPGGAIDTTLLVVLRAGKARGAQKVQVILESPDGSRVGGPELSVTFQGGDHVAQNLVMNLRIPVSSAGLYWADVLVNGRLMSRASMMVNYGFMR
jgi:hypothetical protein